MKKGDDTSAVIEVIWREDKNARAKATTWYTRKALGRAWWLVGIAWSFAIWGSVVFSAAYWAEFFGSRMSAPWAPEAAAMLAIMAIVGFNQFWCRFSARRVYEGNSGTDGGPTTYRFDSNGFRHSNNLSEGHIQWAGIGRVEETDHGLFFANKGNYFCLPKASWESAELFEEQAKQVVAWWCTATVPEA